MFDGWQVRQIGRRSSWLPAAHAVATLACAPGSQRLTCCDARGARGAGPSACWCRARGLDANFIGHARTAVDDATPIRYVAGPATNLSSPTGIATDRAKNCAEGNSVDGCVFRDNFEAGDVCYWSSGVGTPACV